MGGWESLSIIAVTCEMNPNDLFPCAFTSERKKKFDHLIDDLSVGSVLFAVAFSAGVCGRTSRRTFFFFFFNVLFLPEAHHLCFSPTSSLFKLESLTSSQ